MVDLARRLEEQEHPARDQDEVPPGEREAEHGHEGRRELHDRHDRHEQGDPCAHREEEPHLAGACPQLGLHTIRQDRDEHDVVDAEDDLEHRERRQGDPGVGVGDPVHCPSASHGWAMGADTPAPGRVT